MGSACWAFEAPERRHCHWAGSKQEILNPSYVQRFEQPTRIHFLSVTFSVSPLPQYPPPV